MDLREKIERAIAKHPEWDNRKVAKCAGGRVADVQAVREGAEIKRTAPIIHPPAAPPAKVKAIPLASIHLLSKKPLDMMKGRLYGLERGMGYPVQDLARAWGVSEETLKNHAKNHHALAYCEPSPGEYVPIIVHPDTPRGDLS
jgi:hypothetical protein